MSHVTLPDVRDGAHDQHLEARQACLLRQLHPQVLTGARSSCCMFADANSCHVQNSMVGRPARGPFRKVDTHFVECCKQSETASMHATHWHLQPVVRVPARNIAGVRHAREPFTAARLAFAAQSSGGTVTAAASCSRCTAAIQHHAVCSVCNGGPGCHCSHSGRIPECGFQSARPGAHPALKP